MRLSCLVKLLCSLTILSGHLGNIFSLVDEFVRCYDMLIFSSYNIAVTSDSVYTRIEKIICD